MCEHCQMSGGTHLHGCPNAPEVDKVTVCECFECSRGIHEDEEVYFIRERIICESCISKYLYPVGEVVT